MDESIDDHVDVLARDPDQPLRSQGPRLTDRLRSLIGNVRDQYRATTAAQKRHEAELRTEHRDTVDAIDRFEPGHNHPVVDGHPIREGGSGSFARREG